MNLEGNQQVSIKQTTGASSAQIRDSLIQVGADDEVIENVLRALPDETPEPDAPVGNILADIPDYDSLVYELAPLQEDVRSRNLLGDTPYISYEERKGMAAESQRIRPDFNVPPPTAAEKVGYGVFRGFANANLSLALLGERVAAERFKLAGPMEPHAKEKYEEELADIQRREEALGEFEPGVAGFAQGVSQFLTGFRNLGGFTQKGKKILQSSPFIGTAVTSAATGMTGFSGQTARMADLYKHFDPDTQSAFINWLAVDPNDSFMEGRAKNALEYAMVDGGVVGGIKVIGGIIDLMKGFQAYRSGARAKERGYSPEQVDEIMERVAESPLYEDMVEEQVRAKAKESVDMPLRRDLEDPQLVDEAQEKLVAAQKRVDDAPADAQAQRELGELQKKWDELQVPTKAPTLEELKRDWDDLLGDRPDPYVRPPRQPYKTNLEAKRGLEGSRGAEYLKGRLLKKFPIKGATKEEAEEVVRFIDEIGIEMFDDVSLSVTNKIPAAGRFKFAEKLVEIRQSVIDNGDLSHVMIHELWHALSRNLPREMVPKLTKEFRAARKKYIAGMQKKAANTNLTPRERQSYKDELARFMKGDVHWGNNRFLDVDEYFADTMLDAFFKHSDQIDARAPKGTFKHVAQSGAYLLKSMLASLKSKLGISHTQKIFNDYIQKRYKPKPVVGWALDPFGRSVADLPKINWKPIREAPGKVAEKTVWDKLVRPVRDRMSDIHPSLSHKLDEFFFTAQEIENDILAAGGDFFRPVKDRRWEGTVGWHDLNKAEKEKFNILALNFGKDPVALYKYLGTLESKLPGITGEFRQFQRSQEYIFQLKNSNGIPTESRANYLPNKPVNVEGLQAHLGVDDELTRQLKIESIKRADDVQRYSTREEALDHQAEVGGRMAFDREANEWIIAANPKPLTRDERIALTEKYFERREQPVGPGSKARLIEDISEDMAPFYGSIDERVARDARNTAMKIAQNRTGIDGTGVNGYESINTKISKLVDDGKITIQQGEEARRLWRVAEEGANRLVGPGTRLIRSVQHVTSIANIFSTISQVGDWLHTLTKFGAFDTLNLGRANLPKISLEDINIEALGHEFSWMAQAGKQGKLETAARIAQKGLDKVLRSRFTGFRFFDAAFKANRSNAAFRSAHRMLKKGKDSKAYKEWEAEWKPKFEGDFPHLVDAIKRGDVSDPNVRLYLFSEMSGYHPVSPATMPELYLDLSFGRLFYTLKSYSLTALNITRRDVTRKLASGDKKQMVQGMRDAIRLAVVGGGAGTIYAFKDWLLGRDSTWGENLSNAYLERLGSSRYITNKLTSGNKLFVRQGLMEPFVPAKSFDLVDMVVTPSKYDWIHNVPVFGKLYSNWMPRGVDVGGVQLPEGGAHKYKREKRAKRARKQQAPIKFPKSFETFEKFDTFDQ